MDEVEARTPEVALGDGYCLVVEQGGPPLRNRYSYLSAVPTELLNWADLHDETLHLLHQLHNDSGDDSTPNLPCPRETSSFPP